jgi:hypothetical protein
LELLRRAKLGDAEVEQLDERPSRRVHDEDIVGLQVAVHDAGRVRRFEPRQHLQRVVERDVERELLSLLEQRREAPPLEKLHHDVRDAVARLIDVGHVRDVRTLDAGRKPRFAKKALDEPRPSRELGVQELERDARSQILVPSLEHGAHPSVADESDEAVLPVDEFSWLGAHPFREHSTEVDVSRPRFVACRA